MMTNCLNDSAAGMSRVQISFASLFHTKGGSEQGWASM